MQVFSIIFERYALIVASIDELPLIIYLNSEISGSLLQFLDQELLRSFPSIRVATARVI